MSRSSDLYTRFYSTMRSVLAFALLFFIVQLSAIAQLSAGIYVVPTEALDDASANLLQERVRNAISATGNEARDGFAMVALFCKYTEVSDEVVAGARAMHSLDGDISLILAATETGQVLGSTHCSVNGSGKTKIAASRDAISSIRLPEADLTKMFASAKSSYPAMAAAWSKGLLRDANRAFAKEEYDDCINIASDVPNGSPTYKDAQDLINKALSARKKKIEEDRKRADTKEERDIKIAQQSEHEMHETVREALRTEQAESRSGQARHEAAQAKYEAVWLRMQK
jgi:hypothetical protein